MIDNVFISHVRKVGDSADWKEQSNEEHSNGVAELSARFASEFGCEGLGRVIGLLHDKGKEQKDFQIYIRKVSGMCPELVVTNHPAHAYVGALIAKIHYKNLLPFLAYPIMGHHSGMYDYGDYETIMSRSIPSDVNSEKMVESLALPSFKNQLMPYDCHHIIRMLFSCLVDADFLDTERFMKPEEAELRGGKKTLAELKPLLDNHLHILKSRAKDTEVNRIRNQVQQVCLDAAVNAPGFYSLTVPTGGGKTLSSLVWAINHALKYGKRRIIIAIPYTSIIVQTAQTLRKIFGVENVLEHHSNFSFVDILNSHEYDADVNGNDVSLQMKLATENWDYPIVVTTNVQLFESMYSNRPSHCRKLHNLCNSVLILDEVQTLPTEYLQPIVNALKCYQRLFGMSVLFTTASQPVLDGRHRGNNPRVKFEGIEKITELIPHPFALHDKLRRVKLHFDEERNDYDEIAERLSQHDKVLCVVNTRKDAVEIFNRLPQEDGALTLHLSRMMCPKHISDTISLLKQELKSNHYEIIRVVSTQLIEAGVDIDFPVVYRQEAGLDSVLQAAGRCNREGKMGIGDAYIFKLNKALPPGFLSRTNQARLNMMGKVADKFSTEAMTEYFLALYNMGTNTFDKAEIKTKLECPDFSHPDSLSLMFESAANEFHLIDDDSVGVVVNYENSFELIEQLKRNGSSYSLMKKLGQYTVSLRRRDFEKMKGLYDEVIEGVFFVSDRNQYDSKIGLITDNLWLDELLIK